MTTDKSRTTRTSRIIKASREVIYRAFLEPDAVASWLAPDTMKGQVHTFEPYEGGKFRISLTYQNPEDSQSGKTSADTDTFQGKFVELIPDEKIVWITEFEAQQSNLAGEMKITWNLVDVAEGTKVTVLFEDIPEGIGLEDNELGSRQSLQKLAAFVERGT